MSKYKVGDELIIVTDPNEETEKLKFSANVVAKNYDDALSSIII